MSQASHVPVATIAEQPRALSRPEAEQALRGMCSVVRAAAADASVGERLATAQTTTAVRVREFPELAAHLCLDCDPIEVKSDADVTQPPEIELVVPAARLAGLWEQAVPALILTGDIGYHGPVSKLLRVLPVLRHHATGAPPAVPKAVPGPPSPGGITPEVAKILDDAADYEYRFHRGAPTLREETPGDFWSIECIDVHKSFDSHKVLDGLNLGIPEGMITAVMGPSGTGKSVLIKHVVGLLFPDKGQVCVHGRAVGRMRRSELLKMRQEFGILFQDGALFGSMPVYDNVAFPLRQHTNLSEQEIREIVERRLAEVGLRGEGPRMPNELSGGMRKRAGFARALVLEPKIVLFDEPDSGLDPVRTALLCELIRKMHATYGGTYIVITHDTASARQVADYIAVLWKGRIVEAGPAQEMFASENPFVHQFLNRETRGPLGME